MKIILPIILLVIIGYSFVRKHLPESKLQVFFMQSFNNDSIRFSTSVTNDLRLRVRAQESAQDSSAKMILNMNPQDTVVCIRNITGQDSVKAKFRGERYLYVYYKAPKYTMRFSNKTIFVEWWPREMRDIVQGLRDSVKVIRQGP
jgi:hypothetical protein